MMKIAVLIPCHNEALTIGKVILAFQTILPNAQIYVYDNNSTDNTFSIAQSHGVAVKKEFHKGKGNVVRRMFSDIEADIYVLIDGDDTYDVKKAPELIQKLIDDDLDMVVGTRVEIANNEKYQAYRFAYRFGHRFGNSFFSNVIAKLFGKKFTDVFSGYRIFSKRFVKSFPASSHGFDIETEFTVHSLELQLPTAEIETPYGARPEGSVSKLNSYRDGCKILWRILLLLKEGKPLLFFGMLFAVLFTGAVVLSIPILITYLHTGLVYRIPTAILSTGIMLLACMCLGCGIILDNVCRSRKEMKRFFYLLTRKI